MVRKSLSDKVERCLFIGPKFFGYENDISEAIERAGLTVDFIDERPLNSPWMRAILRIKPSLVGRVIQKHFADQLKIIRDRSYTLIFVLKGEVVPLAFLEEVKRRNLGARFVFYTFDSVSNSANFLGIAHIFDRKFSFDYQDCESYPELELLPLFYAADFTDRRGERPPRVELAFVGTLHSGRYAAVTSITKYFDPVFEYFYCPARWYYWLSKYVTREFKNVPRGAVSFEKMSRDSVASTFRDSRAVIDIQRIGQAGLTMRTFEVLASGAGLITTNKYVDRLPPELRRRTLYIERLSEGSSPSKVREFLATLEDNPEVSNDIKKFSIDAWASKLLGQPSVDDEDPQLPGRQEGLADYAEEVQ